VIDATAGTHGEHVSVRTIRDTRGGELRVARSSDGHALTVQATLSTTRILDRRGVRALLDIIASSPEFRREMHNALAVYDVALSHPARGRRASPRPRPTSSPAAAAAGDAPG
jgi:hypothetical protein